MKYIIIFSLMINYSFASCILDESNPEKGCDDVFLIEDGKAVKLSNDKKLKEESVEAPKKDFHWTDELDPEEREWLKKNWD
jgi:hypothetical protein